MTIQEYIIRFLIIHPSLDLSEVKETLSKIPGAVPGRLMNAGAERFTPRGDKLEGRYRDSRWGFDFGDKWQNGEEEELHSYLEKIADKLTPFKDYLLSLKEKGCTMEFIVSVSVERNVGESLSPELMQKFSELGIGLGFDLYPLTGKNGEPGITSLEGYKAMILYLIRYWEEGGKMEEEIVGLFSSMPLLQDGKSADSAKLNDWNKCVEEVIDSREKEETGEEPWSFRLLKN